MKKKLDGVKVTIFAFNENSSKNLPKVFTNARNQQRNKLIQTCFDTFHRQSDQFI
jgi:hypothetical protein